MTLGLAPTHSFEEDDVNASPVFRYPVLVEASSQYFILGTVSDDRALPRP